MLIWHLETQKMLQLQGASPMTPNTIIKFDCFQCYRHSSQSNTCQIITGKDTKHVSKLEIKQLTLNYHLE